MIEVITSRLCLIPLSLSQLELSLLDLAALEKGLGLVVQRDFFTERVHRAIRMKVEKMRKADASKHAWFTYWLIVIREDNAGAGMVGFKGYPNEDGSTEIGYGIDQAYQNKGYTSEAVQVLIDWAFAHPFCKVITATAVENPASRRLLEKLNAQLIEETANSTSWKIVRSPQVVGNACRAG